MQLNSLRLINFQGLRDAYFDFYGASANIYGDNATGKTTVFNAVTWLLFDKPSTGAKNFTPKTKGPDGDLHYLNHSVEACFCLDNSRLLTLKKIFKENYKKKRGSAVEEFDGHIIEYYIDSVPAKEKEYVATLNNHIGPDEQMKMLMMPDYFSEVLTWEARRRILLDMCGDITDTDVITSNSALSDLSLYLLMPGTTDQYYTVDEFKKIAASKRAEINKDLQTIPARIDEAKKAMPDISGIDLLVIDSAIAAANGDIEEKEQEKRQILSGNATATTLRNQISTLQTQLAENRAAYVTESSKQNEIAYAEINQLKSEQIHIKNALSDKKNDHETMRRRLQKLNQDRKTLLDSYTRIYAEQWQGAEICPTCNRPLPEDEVSQAKDAFNLNKSQRLEEINTKGQQECSKDMITALENEIASLNEDIQTTENSLLAYDTLIFEAGQKVQQAAPFESTEAYTLVMNQINELRGNDNQASAAVSQRITTLNNEISSLRTRINGLMAEKSKLALADQQTKRIKDLDASEKRLSQEYEVLQRGVYLCEEFIKTKVSLLTDRINSKFSTVRFRLFIEQLNGGIREDCEVMVPGDGKLVPYTFANNAARINAGMEIINAMAQHLNMSMPVFVDNAESVTRLLDINAQLVRLVVSEADKVLRMETGAGISRQYELKGA